jgi:hypothetical protein
MPLSFDAKLLSSAYDLSASSSNPVESNTALSVVGLTLIIESVFPLLFSDALGVEL